MRNYQLMRPFSLLQDFDDIFYTKNEAKTWKPVSRAKEEENYYHLTMDIPGVDKEHLKVDLKDQVLSVTGERRDHFSEGSTEYDSVARFEQNFTLPKNSNLDEIEVNQHNGILDIYVPKFQKVDTTRSFEIKSGSGSFLKKPTE